MIYFSALTFISAKGSLVPGHIGCIHVYEVNINPERDPKEKWVNTFLHCCSVSEADSDKLLIKHIVGCTECCVGELPVRRDAQVFVEQPT